MPTTAAPALAWDNTYARLPAVFGQRVPPTPVPDPYPVAWSAEAAALLGLPADPADSPDLLAWFAGNAVPPGAEPLAQRYAGHQFGSYVPQLGDGRAVLLGEAVGPAGRWDVQLKGSGPTEFSRFGDGRAVLRSAIREFLASEAMHALGVPTTRALCVVGSDLPVHREEVETAAVLTRLAPCHVRFGSFEVFAWRRQYDEVRTLLDYTIDQHFPTLASRPDRHAAWLREVVTRTARLIAHWQAVGFCHGVMNTDNMSVLGLTLDYGPFGFLEAFDPGHVCNHSDTTGRYAFDRQPAVGLWNLACLAQAVLAVVPEAAVREALDLYAPAFNGAAHAHLRAKLGLRTVEPGDPALWEELFTLLYAGGVDYTTFFRRLSDFSTTEGAANACVAAFPTWAARYRARLLAEASDDADRKRRMDRVNPKYVLRNYLAHRAIEAARDRDFSEVARLHDVLRRPYDEQPGREPYAEPAPEWGRRLVVSCSS
jgi:uncharacterized protein YdiU (UPF0061 family)